MLPCLGGKLRILWHHFARSLFSLGLIVCLAGCQTPGSTKPVLKIGLVAPFEGLHRPLGYEVLFAVKAALQERNTDGGIVGHRVELVALNDFDDPAEAAAQAQELAADAGVRGVIGHLSAETTAAALPIYQANQLAVVVPWSVLNVLFQPSGSAVFVATSVEEAERGLQFHLATADPIRASTLASANVLDRPMDAKALLLDVEAVSAGNWVRRWREAGLQTTIGGLPDAGSQQFVQVAGQFAEGVILASPGPAAFDLLHGETFIETYNQLAGFPPGPRAALAYDAAQVLLDSLEIAILQGDNASRQGVTANLRQIQRQGITGPLAFDENGARIDAPLWFYAIEEGSYPGQRIAP